MWLGRMVGRGEAEKEVKNSIQSSVDKASRVLWFEAAHEMKWGFPGALVIKNPSEMQEMQETQVQCLGREDPLE